MTILAMALAPVVTVLFYIYIRDKYEKEPARLLVVGVIMGLAVTYPIIKTQTWIMTFLPITGIYGEALFTAFITAAMTETAFKLAVLYFLTWHNLNLNEPFDGIVYSVFIALGFAGLENVLYVTHPLLGGVQTALVRMIFSVPAHALFAVTTGYFFTMAKFDKSRRGRHMFLAFAAAWAFHGTYDFLLMSGNMGLLALFVPLLMFMWHRGFVWMRRHLEASPFRA